MSNGLKTMLDVCREECGELRGTVLQERELSHRRHCEIIRLKQEIKDLVPWLVAADSELSAIAAGRPAGDSEFLKTVSGYLRKAYERTRDANSEEGSG